MPQASNTQLGRYEIRSLRQAENRKFPPFVIATYYARLGKKGRGP